MPLEILTRDRGSGHTLDTCPPCRECSLSGTAGPFEFFLDVLVFAFFLFSVLFSVFSLLAEEAGRGGDPMPNGEPQRMSRGWFILFSSRAANTNLTSSSFTLFSLLFNRVLSVPNVDRRKTRLSNLYSLLIMDSRKNLRVICRHSNNHRDGVNSRVWIVTIPFGAKWISICST